MLFCRCWEKLGGKKKTEKHWKINCYGQKPNHTNYYFFNLMNSQISKYRDPSFISSKTDREESQMLWKKIVSKP